MLDLATIKAIALHPKFVSWHTSDLKAVLPSFDEELSFLVDVDENLFLKQFEKLLVYEILEALKQEHMPEGTTKKIRLFLVAMVKVFEKYRRAAASLFELKEITHFISTKLGVIARLSDAAWKWSGDRSSDFNYYTKRASLAGIIGHLIFCWLHTPLSEKEVDHLITKDFDRLFKLNDFKSVVKCLPEKAYNLFQYLRS